MARRGRRSRQERRQIQSRNPARVALVNARPLLPLSPIGLRGAATRSLSRNLYEDRRLYHPLRRNAPPRALRRASLQLVAREPRSSRYRGTAAPISFREPRDVFVCARRQERREVIHARGIAGRRNLRKPRRTALSNINCKR